MLFLKSSIFLIFIIADIFHSIICKNISEADGTLVTEMIQALGYTILLPYSVSRDSGKKMYLAVGAHTVAHGLCTGWQYILLRTNDICRKPNKTRQRL